MLNDKQLKILDRLIKIPEETEENYEEYRAAFNKALHGLLDLHSKEERITRNQCPNCGGKEIYSGWFGICPEASTYCNTCGCETKCYNLHDKKFSNLMNWYRSIRSSINDWNKGIIYIQDKETFKWERVKIENDNRQGVGEKNEGI